MNNRGEDPLDRLNRRFKYLNSRSPMRWFAHRGEDNSIEIRCGICKEVIHTQYVWADFDPAETFKKLSQEIVDHIAAHPGCVLSGTKERNN